MQRMRRRSRAVCVIWSSVPLGTRFSSLPKASSVTRTGLLTCAALAEFLDERTGRLPGTLRFQWHFSRPFPASQNRVPGELARWGGSYQTQEHALTVAGQWRTFTAFPNIPVRLTLREHASETISAAPSRQKFRKLTPESSL